MILADVNILISAFRADAPEHPTCHAWLDRVINGEARYGVSPQVLSGMIHIATHPKIFIAPSSLDDVFDFCDILVKQPHCVVVQPGERHWEIYKRLCTEADARGNLVPSAWFAALAIESGCEWITLDRDYARFPGLHWRVPD